MNEDQSHWAVIWTARMAPAIAAYAGSYTVNQLSLAGVDFKFLGVGSEEVKSALVLGLTLLFVSPMVYIEIVCSTIRSIREFLGSAKQQIRDGLNNPLPPKGDNT